MTTPISLTATQARAAEDVLAAVREHSGSRAVVVLVGLPGTGKTSLLDQMKTDICQVKAEIIEYSAFDSWGEKPRAARKRKLLVTNATPAELRRLRESIARYMPRRKLVVCSLLGMTESEMREWLRQDLITPNGLCYDEVVKYSMGIPQLASDLLIPGLGIEQAATMAAHALLSARVPEKDSVAAATNAQQYLQMPVLQEVQEQLLRVFRMWSCRERIADCLHHFHRMRRMRYDSAGGEVNPLFVAPGSESFYDNMLALSEARKDNRIWVYVPRVSADLAEKFLARFGFNQYFQEFREGYESLFRTSKRKVAFWLRNDRGREIFHDNEHACLPEEARVLRQRAAAGEFQIPASTQDQWEIVIGAHEHFELFYHTVLMGWMIESQLQQIGVSYAVINMIADVTYSYQADQNQIVQFSTAVWPRPPR